jgi:hypothetical protein
VVENRIGDAPPISGADERLEAGIVAFLGITAIDDAMGGVLQDGRQTASGTLGAVSVV